MLIKKIKIISFRGVKNFEISLNEKLNVFSGANGIGKSTIIDSIMWVLCGETLVFGKQDSDNRNSNALREKVNVILELEDGLELERKYYDVWVEDEDGNLKYSRTENQFFVNGAKYKKEEFYQFIRNQIGLEVNIKTKDYNLLRSLMDFNYFGSIDYKEARKFMEELLQLKSDKEILTQEKFINIAKDMEIQKYDIAKILNKYENEYKLCCKTIEEKTNLLNTYKSQLDVEKLKEYDSLVEERNTIISKVANDEKEYFDLNQSLSDLQENIKKEEKNVVETILELQNKKNDLITKGNEYNSKIAIYQNQINSLNDTINRLKELLEKKKISLEVEKNKSFSTQYCPHCKKAINEQEENNFKIIQEQIISQYEDNIKFANNEIVENENKINELNKIISQLTEEKSTYAKDFYEVENKLNVALKEKEDNPKVKEMLSKSEKIRIDISTFVNNFNNSKAINLKELQVRIDELSYMRTLPQTIAIIESEIKKLKVERATKENNKILVKEFKELKLQMIKENTSRVFPKLEIEILEENENTGNFKEVCYAKLKGVEYKGVNDGHRKYVGIMVIEDIKRALNLQDLPIIFDKRADIDSNMLEEICKITNAQILTTQVSDDKEILLKGE